MDMDLLEVTEKIRALLRLHPEGLSITSIAFLSEMNRNTLVKYLEIMQSQGSVGMRQVGVAKVYYLADRIPVSAVRRFCRHYIIVDHILDLVETSASIPACLGMPAGERTSRRIYDQFPGLQGIPDLEARLRSALRDEEETVRWSTGRHQGNRVFSVSFIPTVLESGRPATSLVLEDVTESDRSGGGGELDALRSQALFEDQSEYIVRLSPEGYVHWANPGYCRMMDQTKHDLIGQRFRPPATGDEREQWNRQLRSLTAEHPVTTIECRISARNNLFLWQRWTLRALYASSGMLLEYQLVGHDASKFMATRGEFPQCKEELEKQVLTRGVDLKKSKLRCYEDVERRERVESRSWFARFAVENSTDGICWIDGPGRILYANRALCENLGYTQDELQALYYPDIDTRCDRESFEQMWMVLRREGRYRIESTLLKIDRTLLPAEITAKYLELNGTRYCCAFFRIFSGAGSGELFRKAFDESPTALALYDGEGNRVHVNKAFQELSGTFPSSGGRGIDPLECPGLTREQIGALQEGRPVASSRSIGLEGGESGITYLETTVTPLCDPGKHPPGGYLVQVQSVDEQRAGEAAAGSSGGLLDEVIRSLPDAGFAIDRKGRVIAWNRAMEKMTGIRAADMLGKGNYEYALPFYRERVPMLVDRAAGTETALGDRYAGEEGNFLIAERAISLPDGYSRVILEKALPVYVDAGQVSGAIEFVHDITTLRHTEELLKRERMFNTAVLEAIDALIMITDDDGRIVWCNERYRTLTGYTGPELTGRAIHELSGTDPGDAGQPFPGPGPVKDGKRLPIRWSRRTFMQPGVGRFDIYTGICPVTSEVWKDLYERTE